jgi:hypothetical protein
MNTDNLKCLLCGNEGVDPKYPLGWTVQVITYNDDAHGGKAPKWYHAIKGGLSSSFLALALTFGIHRGCLYERLCELYPELRERVPNPFGDGAHHIACSCGECGPGAAS